MSEHARLNRRLQAMRHEPARASTAARALRALVVAAVPLASGPALANVADVDKSFWNSPALSGPKTLREVPAKGRSPCGRYVLYCPRCDVVADSPSIAYDVSTNGRVAAVWLSGGCRTPQGVPPAECEEVRRAVLEGCRR